MTVSLRKDSDDQVWALANVSFKRRVAERKKRREPRVELNAMKEKWLRKIYPSSLFEYKLTG